MAGRRSLVCEDLCGDVAKLDIWDTFHVTPSTFDWINPAMNLRHLLNARLAAGKPVRVALIGAGKFGSMFLSQVPHTPGLEVPVIVDLDPERAREACRTVGWEAE